MGTYGVTHVKNADTIIAFSDSYDGYIGGGMGQANMLCIKYLSTPVLRRLFDAYTASEKVAVANTATYADDEDYDSEEAELSQRAIDDVVYRVKQDTGSDDAAEWMRGVLSGSVRTSMTGFAPLLYLNINNHYGRDYRHYDYLVDLDSEEFVHHDVHLSFAKIRAASINQIDALCNMMRELLPVELQEFGYEAFGQRDSSVQAQNRPSACELIDAYLSIDDAAVDAVYRQREEDRQRYLAERSPNVTVDMEDDDSLPGAYSIRSGTTTVPNLRAIVALMQKLKIQYPETAFLTSTCEWGTNEDVTEASIRTFSPMTRKAATRNIHELFINTLEDQFKMRLNIFSSTGSWSHDVVPSSDDNGGFGNLFAEVVPGPQKSVYTLDEVRGFDHGPEMIASIDPALSLHADYEEVRALLLGDEATMVAPIIWVYMALLYQDADVFAKAYPGAQVVMAGLDDATRKAANSKYLQCLADAKVINNVVAAVGEMVGKPYDTGDSDRFLSYLGTTSFFTDVSPYMNGSEKARYAA